MATGPSILETPTYIVAMVLAAFLVASYTFDWIVSTIKRFLKNRKRVGMLRAVEYSVNELTLLGFISLIVISLEPELSNICVNIQSKSPEWTILHNLYYQTNCPCCLGSTANVQDCVFQYAACGSPDYPTCNCDAQDSTCVATFLPTYDSQRTTSYVGGRRRQLLAASESDNYGGSSCIGPLTIENTCPPGQKPAVSFLALEQIHLLVFAISVIHVFSGFVLYAVASARIWIQWAHWERLDDPEARKVREAVNVYFSSLDNSTNTGKLANSSDALDATRNTPSISEIKETVGVDDALPTSSSSPLRSANDRRSTQSNSSENDDGQLPDLESQRCTQEDMAPKSTSGSDRSLPRLAEVASMPPILGSLAPQEPSQNEKKSAASRALEALKCTILGLSPKFVRYKQYVLLRASFVYTHKLGAGFAFLEHVQRSLEEDLSLVVGLSFEFWAVTILFYLLSGPFGYAVTPAVVLAAAVLIPTNAKLVNIIRYVSSHGGAARLSSRTFPFNRPTLLLIPIKLSLFLCAFIYANFLYLLWQFGPKSCCFTDEFYPGWVLPWWTILIVNTLIFLHMGAVTLPAYSLAVQMGSDWKAHMLPQRLTKKLLGIAAEVKAKVRAERDANALREEIGEGAKSVSASQLSVGEGEGAMGRDGKRKKGRKSKPKPNEPSKSMERMLSVAARRLLSAE